jgi:hypothetical protein
MMIDARHHFCLGCCVTARLVGDDGPWNVLKTLEQFAKELLRRLLIPPRLHQNIEHLAVLVDGSKMTLAQETRAGAGGAFRGSMRTVPVKYSTGPFWDGWEPARLSCMGSLLGGWGVS